jgi:conjugal transfer ATP-binding protein TraC
MSYQIPQQLQYKEKIMFGLTFKQLAYAFVFGILALSSFRVAGNEIGTVLALFFIVSGACFVFLNVEDYIKSWAVYLKFRKANKGDEKLEKFLEVKEIENDLIVLDKKKKVAILKIYPMNFGIKPKKEKDTILYSFQKFLNSLDFPTQILMRTEPIDLRTYVESLKSRITRESLVNLFENYKKHLHNLVSSEKIMDRVFYLVIPENGNIKIQIDICKDKLSSLNLKTKRLKSWELKVLLRKYFMGGKCKSLLGEISPEKIENFPEYFKINDKFCRIVYAHGYPRTVEAGFLDKIVSSLGDFDLSLHIRPYPIENMLIDINRELQKQRADLFSMSSKGIINPTLEIQHKDTKSTLEALQKGQERLFNVGLYVNCKADSLEQLNLLTKKVESELNSIMILPRVANLKMMQGFKSIAPLGIDKLNITRNITTEALSAFFPFTSQFLEVDDTGVWLGQNKNNIPIIKDIFKLSNPNGLVLAQSGGGKSYFCKLLITRYLLNNTKVIVIDPQGEYRSLIKQFEGQRINLSRKSKTIINPLDLMGHDYTEKRLSLMDLMQVMLGTLTEPQKAFIDRAITEAYTRRGINEKSKTWGREPPILGDVWEELRILEKDAIQLEKSTLRSLMNRLSMYTTGVFKFLNKHTNIDFQNDFVCFDIGDMPKQVKPTIMFLVLDYVYMKMKSDLQRKILLIDEAWTLLSRTEDASYIFEIVKTCRKFNMGLLLINQEVEGLLTSQAGKSVLANSAYTMLMRQKPAVIDNICKTFNLSNNEKNHLLTANIGEGLLITENDHSQIKVIASPEEHKVITTNADELIEQGEESEEEEPVKKRKQSKNERKVTLDPKKGIFKESELKKHEIAYLQGKGYITSKQKGITGAKQESYLLKPRFNESPQHFFLTKDIERYLKLLTKKVEIFETKKPDIIFEVNKKKWAIEVETGKMLKNNKKQLLEKVKQLKKDYGNNWFFVVTNMRHAPKYRRLGKTYDKRYLAGHLSRLFQGHQIK